MYPACTCGSSIGNLGSICFGGNDLIALPWVILYGAESIITSGVPGVPGVFGVSVPLGYNSSS